MKICLKTLAKQSGTQQEVITLQDRLPEHINQPCELACEFQVERCGHYYLLTLKTKGAIAITCQRCLHEFQHEYNYQTKLAVCAEEVDAETLMESFECIVALDHQIDLAEVLTDDMHLYTPEKHPNTMECNPEQASWIGSLAS